MSPEYAATVDDEGLVQLQSCYGSRDLVVENVSTGSVTEVSVVDGPDPIEITDLSGIPINDDDLVRVWEQWDFERSQPGPEAVLEFRVVDLEPRRMWHDGGQIYPAHWNEICDGGDFSLLPTGAQIVFLLAMLLVLLLLIVGIVVAPVRLGREHNRRDRPGK